MNVVSFSLSRRQLVARTKLKLLQKIRKYINAIMQIQIYIFPFSLSASHLSFYVADTIITRENINFLLRITQAEKKRSREKNKKLSMCNQPKPFKPNKTQHQGAYSYNTCIDHNPCRPKHECRLNTCSVHRRYKTLNH